MRRGTSTIQVSFFTTYSITLEDDDYMCGTSRLQQTLCIEIGEGVEIGLVYSIPNAHLIYESPHVATLLD